MSSAQEQFKKARRRMLKQATKQPITATCSTSCRRLGFVWFGLTLPMITFANDIVTDGTLGGGLHTLPGGHGTIPQNWGTAAGPNLFHSFSDFNIDTGKTATFTENVPNTFDNVITRITGNNPSAINGTLQSTMGHAAFYFINPNGITFGPNAQVDVPGALHLTTADKLNFQNNGGSFYANAQQLSQMSNELPAGVGFLGTSVQNNGLISFNGSQIALQPNQTLDVVGGEITVDNNAKLTTSAGDIRLVAIQNAGTVDIQMNANGALPLPPKMPNESNSGNITLTGSILNADGNGGGNLGVWGNQIIIREDSSASADNLGYLSLVNNSLNIKSASLLIDNSTLSSSAYSTGNAGNVTVQARTVGIVNQGFLSSDTWSSGKAGQVSVTADQLSIDGKAATYATGIFSNAEEGSGHAGEITVQAGTLNIVNQGQIASSTWSSGNAGQVSVTADQLTINSQGARYATGIFSHAEAGSGHAGEIAVQAGRLNIVNQGQIASSTWSSGNAGRNEPHATMPLACLGGQGQT